MRTFHLEISATVFADLELAFQLRAVPNLHPNSFFLGESTCTLTHCTFCMNSLLFIQLIIERSIYSCRSYSLNFNLRLVDIQKKKTRKIVVVSKQMKELFFFSEVYVVLHLNFFSCHSHHLLSLINCLRFLQGKQKNVQLIMCLASVDYKGLVLNNWRFPTREIHAAVCNPVTIILWMLARRERFTSCRNWTFSSSLSSQIVRIDGLTCEVIITAALLSHVSCFIDRSPEGKERIYAVKWVCGTDINTSVASLEEVSGNMKSFLNLLAL